MENKTCWKRRNIRPLPTLNCENHPKKRLCGFKERKQGDFCHALSVSQAALPKFQNQNEFLACWVILRESCVVRHAHFCQIVLWFLQRNATEFEEKVWETKKSLQPTSKKKSYKYIIGYVYDQSYRTQRSLLVHGHGMARCFNIRSPAKRNTNKNEYPQQKIDAGPRINRKPSPNPYLGGVPAATSGRTLFLTTPRAPAYSGDEVGCLWQDAVWGFLVGVAQTTFKILEACHAEQLEPTDHASIAWGFKARKSALLDNWLQFGEIQVSESKTPWRFKTGKQNSGGGSFQLPSCLVSFRFRYQKGQTDPLVTTERSWETHLQT